MGACDRLSGRKTNKLKMSVVILRVRGTDGLVALTAHLSVPAPTFPEQSLALLNSPGPAFYHRVNPIRVFGFILYKVVLALPKEI